MKALTKEDISPIEDLKNKLWDSLNILRGDSNISSDNYHFILYFLLLQKEGLLNEFKFSQSGVDYRIEFYNLIFKLHIKTEDAFREISEVYGSIIEKVNENTLTEIIDFFKSLNQFLLKKHFPEI